MNFQLRFLTENFIRLFGISFFDHIVESKSYNKCWLKMNQYDFGVTVWELKKTLVWYNHDCLFLDFRSKDWSYNTDGFNEHTIATKYKLL